MLVSSLYQLYEAKDIGNCETEDDFALTLNNQNSSNQSVNSEQDSKSFKSLGTSSHADEGDRNKSHAVRSLIDGSNPRRFNSDTSSTSSSQDDSSYIPSGIKTYEDFILLMERKMELLSHILNSNVNLLLVP